MFRGNEKPTTSPATESQALRDVYAALNRNDIEATVSIFDARIAWIEPPEYGGTFLGFGAVKTHLSQSRATWVEGGCEPERIVVFGEKALVFIRVHVWLKNETEWREGRHVAAWTFRNGKAIEMRIFGDEQGALEWADKDQKTTR